MNRLDYRALVFYLKSRFLSLFDAWNSRFFMNGIIVSISYVPSVNCSKIKLSVLFRLLTFIIYNNFATYYSFYFILPNLKKFLNIHDILSCYTLWILHQKWPTFKFELTQLLMQIDEYFTRWSPLRSPSTECWEVHYIDEATRRDWNLFLAHDLLYSNFWDYFDNFSLRPHYLLWKHVQSVTAWARRPLRPTQPGLAMLSI